VYSNDPAAETCDQKIKEEAERHAVPGVNHHAVAAGDDADWLNGAHAEEGAFLKFDQMGTVGG